MDPRRESPADETCWAEVDLSALRGNYRLVRALAPSTPLLAVVKANAYGHGAVPVGRALLEEGAEGLGVATLAEGRELREAGISGRVMVMGRLLPSEAGGALRWGLEAAIPDLPLAEALSAEAVRRGVTAPVHLKVDTGMARLGIPWQEAGAALARLASLPGLSLAGVFTHFANADLADTSLTAEQARRFEAVMEQARPFSTSTPGTPGTPGGPLFHLANSAATLTGVGPAGAGRRPGLVLYGCLPSPRLSLPGLRPVMSWRCRILQVREVPAGTGVSYGHDFTTRRPSRLATIAVGYADGFSRALGNRARVLLRGRRVPVVGRVCMDLSILDVTDVPGAAAGEVVTLLGGDGEERVTADELAALAGTISYEVLCAISPRVPRLPREER